MRKFRDILLGCIIAGLISTCADLNLAGGGLDTETSGGTVVGLLVAEDGTPEKYAKVFCVPSSYNGLKDPQLSDSFINTTDETGCYRFSRVKKGGYNIQAVSPDKKTNVLICGINVDKDSIIVPSDTLHPSATLKIVFPDNGNSASGYCYLPGTTFFTPVQNGLAVMSDVPAGFIPAANYFDTRDSTKNHVVKAGFFISPDDTTVITDLTPWKFSKKLFLNTTVTGANITGNVYDFPVLVRLTSSNLDFAGVGPDGSDLRFAKSDNTPLPYEIEQWDAKVRRAEIWVKIDTIYGNDSTQYINMYWGNPNATSASNGAAVFDTGKGFQGVWHLGEMDSLASDATGNRLDGTGYFTTPAAGMIGNARYFNGYSGVIRMKGTASSRLSFPMNGRYSVSAWVYHDTLADSVTYLIAGKGEHQYFIKNFDLGLSTGQPARQWEFSEYHENDWQSATFVPATAKSWVYLVGVRDGSNEYLYVNGILAMNKVFAANQGQSFQDTSDDFAIGGFLRPVTTFNQGYSYFRGIIDEVTVSNTPRSADWVKLNYMNQKEKDALVRW